MALSATTVWEIRTAGHDDNGGGFDSTGAGTDYSQQDAKNTVGNNISTTDAVANGTTTITSASASFTSALVGNIVHFEGGSGSIAAQKRRVTAVTNATTITIDQSISSSTGMTMNIGGALASLGRAGQFWNVAGQTAWIKTGTYSVTSASTNVAAGCFSRAGYIFGYQTSRGDWGTKPVLQASGISTFTIISVSATGVLRNVTVDGGSLTSSRGISATNGGCYVLDCRAINCTNSGFVGSSGPSLSTCEASGCSTQPAFLLSSVGFAINLWAQGNSVSGFSVAAGHLMRCVSSGNSGASSDGFLLTGASLLMNCVSYNNGRDGFRSTAATQVLINCIAESNTSGIGFNNNTATNLMMLTSCAAYNNSTDVALGTFAHSRNDNFVTGTGSFFTDATVNDYSLNNLASRGAALRAAGYPNEAAGGNTDSFLDVGAAQHQDGAGGGGGGSRSYGFFG